MPQATIIKQTNVSHQGKQLLISTALIGDEYETMAMLPNGYDIASAYSQTEPAALLDHDRLVRQYTPKQPKPAPPLSGKYAELADALKVAVAAARLVDLEDDGGTCNFDGMKLYLPHWQESKVEAAAKAAGLNAFKHNHWGTSSFVFSVPVSRQGNARTRQAEAMLDAMKSQGYATGMYYQMD